MLCGLFCNISAFTLNNVQNNEKITSSIPFEVQLILSNKLMVKHKHNYSKFLCQYL